MPIKKGSASFIDKLMANLQLDKKADGKDEIEGPSWIKYVAMLTGVLAALSGFLVVRSTNLTNDAIYASNQAILNQTEASDAWSEYQANSIKARIIETQLMASSRISLKDRAELSSLDDEIRARQPESKKTAEDKTSERDSHLKEGLKHLADRDLLSYASLAAQLGIALVSVAAMVHRRIAFDFGVIVGLIGVGLTAYVFINNFISQQ